MLHALCLGTRRRIIEQDQKNKRFVNKEYLKTKALNLHRTEVLLFKCQDYYKTTFCDKWLFFPPSHWKALGFVKTRVNNKVYIFPPWIFFLLQLIWLPFVIYLFCKKYISHESYSEWRISALHQVGLTRNAEFMSFHQQSWDWSRYHYVLLRAKNLPAKREHRCLSDAFHSHLNWRSTNSLVYYQCAVNIVMITFLLRREDSEKNESSQFK